jgi:hypothetical protein
VTQKRAAIIESVDGDDVGKNRTESAPASPATKMLTSDLPSV